MDFIQNVIQNTKINLWNYFNAEQQSTKKYYRHARIYYDNFTNTSNNNIVIDDKQSRINTLLYIKQVKNTYYKYENIELFNPELYNIANDDDNFDGGLTAYDDDDENIRIFDKYILEYIKNRNDLMTYLKCKDKNIKITNDLHTLDKHSVLFVIDMCEKELFNYCYSFIQKIDNVHILKDIIFSIILNHDGKHVRINISNFQVVNNNHPYIIIENILSKNNI